MNEGMEGQSGASVHQRMLRRRQQLQQAQLEAEPFLPAPSTQVDGFTLLAQVGQGGFGTVYLAQRGEHWCAVKFLFLPRAAAWARRELEVMLRLHTRVGPRLEAHGYWPVHEPRFLYLAMEYVPGRTARDWARVDNPSAWAVAGLMRDFSEQLEVVHAAGVVHRDVKLQNVLVREDGRPVLLDFGASTYVGAPEVTGPQPPTTRPYRSPEAVRFARGYRPGQRSARPLDDVWAQGVMFYWLLTGHYPFVAEQRDPDDALGDAILHLEPRAPHTLNPRVPRALSEVCLRLLRKAPEERYPDAGAVCEALKAVLKEAKEDTAWHVPLCAAWGPDTVTTEQEVALSQEGWRRRAERVEAYEREHPVRGVPAPVAEPDAALPPSEEESPESPSPSAPAVLAPAMALPQEVEPGAQGPAPQPAPPSRPAQALWRPLALGTLAPVLLLAAVLLARGGHREAPVQWEVPGALGQEVAPPWRAPEGGEGAVPPWALTPAPVASATPSKDMRVKTSQQTPSPQKPKRKALGRTLKAAGVATCTALAGCPAAQVLPNPPGEPCPPGAVEAMEKAGLFGYPQRIQSASFLGFQEEPSHWAGKRIFVRPGSATLQSHERRSPLRYLSGRLLFGEGRVYGRFTEAKLESGESIPVCYEVYDTNERKAGTLMLGNDGLTAGTVMRGPNGVDTARIISSVVVRAVRRFE